MDNLIKTNEGGGRYTIPSLITATKGNTRGRTITATADFSGKVTTVSGFVYSNNDCKVTLEILVNGSWITCSSSNGTIAETITSSDRQLRGAVWANSGIYKDTIISGARVTDSNNYDDGWLGAHCIAVVV